MKRQLKNPPNAYNYSVFFLPYLCIYHCLPSCNHIHLDHTTRGENPHTFVFNVLPLGLRVVSPSSKLLRGKQELGPYLIHRHKDKSSENKIS